MRLGDLTPGTRFLQPATGLTGTLEGLSPCAALVRLGRFRDVVVRGQVKARVAEATTWSLETEVQELLAEAGVCP
jgi:hypothetical protein